MPLCDKKLGLLISCGPEKPNFEHGFRLAETALREGARVYLYCIDDAVTGMADGRMRLLAESGAHLFACAYGAQRRNCARVENTVWAGLSSLSDILAGTDRFVAFH